MGLDNKFKKEFKLENGHFEFVASITPSVLSDINLYVEKLSLFFPSKIENVITNMAATGINGFNGFKFPMSYTVSCTHSYRFKILRII